jgi:outer membrane protein TolC
MLNCRTALTLRVAALGLCLALPALADDGGLHLADALKQALVRNADVGIAQARLAEAQATRAKAWTAYLPSVMAVGQASHTSIDDVYLDMGKLITGLAGILAPGLTVPKDQLPKPTLLQRQNSVNGAISVDQTVFALGPILMARAAARNVDAQEALLEATRREITYQVSVLFYNAAAVERLIRAAERAVALADQRIAVVEQRRQAGAEGELTVLRARAERDKAEQDLLRAQVARKQLLVALGTLLGTEAPAHIATPAPIEVPAGDLGQWQRSAQSERVDLAARKAALAAVESQLSEARWRWVPMVTANWTGRYTNTPGFANTEYLWAASANVVVPLFDRGTHYAEANERRQVRTRLTLELDKAERELSGGVRQAATEVDAGQRLLATATAQAAKAKRTAEIVANALQAGAATSLEMAEADTGLRVADAGVERERLNLDLAILKLRHLMGAVRAP